MQRRRVARGRRHGSRTTRMNGLRAALAAYLQVLAQVPAEYPVRPSRLLLTKISKATAYVAADDLAKSPLEPSLQVCAPRSRSSAPCGRWRTSHACTI